MCPDRLCPLAFISTIMELQLQDDCLGFVVHREVMHQERDLLLSERRGRVGVRRQQDILDG